MKQATYQNDFDYQVRQAVFAFLADAVRRCGDVLPWKLLVKGVAVQGHQVPLVGRPGIITPAVLKGLPISIRSTPKLEGKTQRYEDEQDERGHLLYSYLIRDPLNPRKDGCSQISVNTAAGA